MLVSHPSLIVSFFVIGIVKLTNFRSYCQGNKRSEHFETLGLHQDASIKEIKSAFLKLSKELHPDVNPSKSASEEFLKIKTAYDSLVQNSSTSKSTVRFKNILSQSYLSRISPKRLGTSHLLAIG